MTVRNTTFALMASAAIATLCVGCKLWQSASRPTYATSPQSMSKTPSTVSLKHPEFAAGEPQSQTLYQLSNSDGIVTGYTMVVNSVYCKDEVCHVVPVNLEWDALGNYERFSLEPGVSLEKLGKPTKAGAATGAPFSKDDYAKLQRILAAEDSPLRKQRYEDLAAARSAKAVDAMTGATPQTLKDSVVDGAALTCFNLWHWANGNVVEKIRALTRESCDEKQLAYFLNAENPRYAVFALQRLNENGSVRKELLKHVLNRLRRADLAQFKLGYAYLRKAMPNADDFYRQLADLFIRSESKARIHLLGILENEKKLPPTLFDSMAEALPKMTQYYELQLYLALLKAHGHTSDTIVMKVGELLDADNFFVARRAYSYLKGQRLPPDLTSRLQKFEERSRKDGRNLP